MAGKDKNRVGIHGTDKETNRTRGAGDGTKPATGANTKPKEKKPCPITRERFLEKANAIVARLEGTPVILNPQEFSTGSFGFHMNGRIELMIDGVKVPCQANLIITAIGSKPEENAAPVKSEEDAEAESAADEQ